MSYTRDWSHTRKHWPELFDAPLGRRQGLRILEIGCFEGQATCWFLENLTDSVVTVIDPFPTDDQHARFLENVRLYGRQRVKQHLRRSQDALIRIAAVPANSAATPSRFDLIYIDGDHHPDAVLTDAVLGWQLLVDDGWMLFDDYDWPDAPDGQDVRTAVDAFTACMGLTGELVGDQYLVRKPR